MLFLPINPNLAKKIGTNTYQSRQIHSKSEVLLSQQKTVAIAEVQKYSYNLCLEEDVLAEKIFMVANKIKKVLI